MHFYVLIYICTYNVQCTMYNVLCIVYMYIVSSVTTRSNFDSGLRKEVNNPLSRPPASCFICARLKALCTADVEKQTRMRPEGRDRFIIPVIVARSFVYIPSSSGKIKNSICIKLNDDAIPFQFLLTFYRHLYESRIWKKAKKEKKKKQNHIKMLI